MLVLRFTEACLSQLHEAGPAGSQQEARKKARKKHRAEPLTHEEAMAKLSKRGRRDDYASGTDALSKRLPGSYESSKGR